ncbi:hypothetical protein [Ruegeria sp. A3M17]|uniref:hypothetical protein n=1 Tax=Ruegeria sp. A3M17 TaxID=2267229 RepID=UPI000DEAC71F|nr:hypothetical protein [Ruegeria sp. A3M17]RBW63039.1 hypothetical protein DS906_01070 [Ruegeria sp. A3M17]
MSGRLDIKRIVVAVEQLELTAPARKLPVLKYLAMHNGGRWDLPSANGDYEPLIKSIELFGVYAMAEDVEELPQNWLKAAYNILMANEAEEATTPPTGTPKLGDEVRFQRSATHHPETGIVRGRQFGTGIIEVEDRNAEQVRLNPDQYEAIGHAIP